MAKRKSTRKKKGQVNLNLGCNRRALRGFVNVDMHPFPGVDVVHDLTKIPWPWDDDSVDFIRVVDLIEHMPTWFKNGFMNEAWRVLKKDGTGKMQILVPHGLFAGAHQDPTHKSYWVENSFCYYAVYEDEDGKLKSHPWRRLYAPHEIQAAFEIQVGTSDPSPPDPSPAGNYGGIVYITAVLTARPDPQDCENPYDNHLHTGSDPAESDE